MHAMLIFNPLMFEKDLQQASSVDPVVIISSINKICLFSNLDAF